MKRPVIRREVIISIPGYRLEGWMSVPEGKRMTDFINTQRYLFLALLDVKIYDWRGEFLEKRDFMAVNKEKISWVVDR